jgi:hypothetical protein
MVRRTSPRPQFLVDRLTERVQRLPALLGEGVGDARPLGDPVDRHLEVELDPGRVDRAADRGGGAVMRRRGERHVAFAGQQSRGRVEADPAGARQIDFRPGVQVGEVDIGPGRPVERDAIGLQLDQVAGDEAGGKAEMPHDLDEQPRRIAARTGTELQRLVRRLNARLEPHQIIDALLEQPIQADQEVDRMGLAPVELRQEPLQMRAGGLGAEIGGQVRPQRLLVGERPCLGGLLDEEVERIVDRHVGDHVDLDPELRRRFGKDEAGEVVAERILLPVDEMPLGQNLERVGRDPGARVRRGSQPDHLRAEPDRPVVSVMRDVMQGCKDRHRRFRVGGSGDWPETIAVGLLAATRHDRGNGLLHCTWGGTVSPPAH